MIKTQIKRAQKRLEAVGAEIGEIVEAAYSDPDADGNQTARELTADEQAKWETLVAEYHRLSDSVDALRAQSGREKLADDAGAMLQASGAWQTDLQAHKDILAVAAGEYRAKRTPEAGHPGQLELATPFIEFDRVEGRNMVRPYGVVWKHDAELNTRVPDLEATFRAADMLASGRGGQYDVHTGKRLEAALETTDVPGSVPSISLALHEYMITMNTVGMYVNVLQTAGLNEIEILRRTAVPKAQIISGSTRTDLGQSRSIGEQESTFGPTAKLRAHKYGFITRYSYESMQTIDVFSMQNQVIRDGGIGLANGVGEHVVNGAGTGSAGTEPQGISTFCKGSTGNQVDGVAASAFTGANGFTPSQLMNLVGTPSQAYYVGGMWRLLTQHGTFVDILGRTGSDGHGVYKSFANIFDMALNPQASGVIFDQNIDAVAQNAFPIILSDLQGYTLRLGGGARIDTTEHRYFENDQRAVRFIQHADGTVVDPNCFYAYKTT